MFNFQYRVRDLRPRWSTRLRAGFSWAILYKKGDKTDCSNYRGISLLPTSYKILSNILLSGLTPYAEEIIEDHECGFRRNSSATDNIFCIR